MDENKWKSFTSSRRIIRVILVVLIATFIFLAISKHFENPGYVNFIANSRSSTTSAFSDNQSTESRVLFFVNELNTTNGFETSVASETSNWKKFRLPKHPSRYYNPNHFGLHLAFDKRVYDIMNMVRIL